MKRLIVGVVTVIALSLFWGASASAQGFGYGGCYGNSGGLGYSAGYGGYSAGYGGYGAVSPGYSAYGGYAPGYGTAGLGIGGTRWHDTTHLDYHRGSIQRHRLHFHYVPGHYDVHRSGHPH